MTVTHGGALDLNQRDVRGLTPFLKACEKTGFRHIQDFFCIVSPGPRAINVNATCRLRYSALMYVCMNEEINKDPAILCEAIHWMCQIGVNFNTIDIDGDTPLLYCLREGKAFQVIKELLECGSRIDCRNNEQENPLTLAARCSSVEVVQLLVEHGANVDSTNKDGVSALMLASAEDRENIAGFLFQHGAKIHIVGGYFITYRGLLQKNSAEVRDLNDAWVQRGRRHFPFYGNMKMKKDYDNEFNIKGSNEKIQNNNHNTTAYDKIFIPIPGILIIY